MSTGASKARETTFEITVVLDKSGSMASVARDAVGGFNQFLDDQEKAEGEARITLVEFDTDYNVVYKDAPVEAAQRLSLGQEAGAHHYVPGGNTALLDALGSSLAESMAAESDEKRKKLFVILTDGEENSSREWTRKAVFETIERQRQSGWDFLFLGANMDAFAEAGKIGIPRGMTASYAADSAGVQAMYRATSEVVSRYRHSGGDKNVLRFTAKERTEMSGEPPDPKEPDPSDQA